MPPPFFTNPSTFDQATALKTALALSVVRLFKSGFTPQASTTLAELEAQEADYDDYASQTITAWLAPMNSPFGGTQITAPTVEFVCTADQVVSNSIGGYWIEKAAGAVVLVRQFDDPVSMANANDGLTLTPTIVVANGFAG